MLASVLLQPAVAHAADAARGAVVAQVRCAPCHHLDSAATHIGPSLKGVFGRPPSIHGVPFRRWDAAALDRWLKNPSAVKPNTKMRIPPISKRDREDIIAYFERQRRRSGG